MRNIDKLKATCAKDCLNCTNRKRKHVLGVYLVKHVVAKHIAKVDGLKRKYAISVEKICYPICSIDYCRDVGNNVSRDNNVWLTMIPLNFSCGLRIEEALTYRKTSCDGSGCDVSGWFNPQVPNIPA
jgi:hypothetical protein